MWTIAIFVVALIAVVGMFTLGGIQTASVTGQITTEDGKVVGKWAEFIVFQELSVKDMFTGSNVAATAKVYDVKPADWGNPRGDFDDASEYNTYTAADGIVLIDDEFPGVYYVVLTATGYNTEFVEVTISDGTGVSVDLSQYNDQPPRQASRMSLVGATSGADAEFTLVNETNTVLLEEARIRVDAETEFRGWKAIINDELDFTIDTDGDGVYDEGIAIFEVTINGKSVELFNPNLGTDLFDSRGEYTMDLIGVKVADKNYLNVQVEIKANTGDYSGVGDEVLGEGDGVISYVKIYDNEGNLFTTTSITA